MDHGILLWILHANVRRGIWQDQNSHSCAYHRPGDRRRLRVRRIEADAEPTDADDSNQSYGFSIVTGLHRRIRCYHQLLTLVVAITKYVNIIFSGMAHGAKNVN